MLETICQLNMWNYVNVGITFIIDYFDCAVWFDYSLGHSRPDITVMVDWALKISYLRWNMKNCFECVLTHDGVHSSPDGSLRLARTGQCSDGLFTLPTLPAQSPDEGALGLKFRGLRWVRVLLGARWRGDFSTLHPSLVHNVYDKKSV